MHPKVFTSVLFAEPGVLDYRITQTLEGADIVFLQDGHVNCEAVARALHDAFVALGLLNARITVKPCETLGREHGAKVKRHRSLLQHRAL